jgi:hypothetical protein
VLCHREIKAGLSSIASSALAASNDSLRISQLASAHPKDFSRIDQSCTACHQTATFHQANVVNPTSCSSCHQEHRGEKGLLPVAESNCVSCHSNAGQMASSAEKGRTLPASLFAPRVADGIILHPRERPSTGHPSLITSFVRDHPEFEALRGSKPDANKLKFNHRLHLEGNVPPVNGKRLECTSCHRPDASGAFMQRISFGQDCRSCHSLNFDENTPGLELPHAEPAQVRAFLRSLPTQYADFAARDLKITRQAENREFVARQLQHLRARSLAGENLERAIFLADGKTGEATGIAGLAGTGRAKFAGCAYCHEVTPQGDAPPRISPTRVPDRWMDKAGFNHARHDAMSCLQCHAANLSTQSAEIIMPSKQSCTECHSPQGGVRSDCSACHLYHHRPPAGLRATITPGPKP